MNLRTALFITISVLTTTAFADEGMWTFDNLPRDALKAKYGFSPDQAWVDHAMRASSGLPLICSGLVQCGVPSASPSNVGTFEESSDLAMPKSTMAIAPSSRNMILVGLMLR